MTVVGAWAGPAHAADSVENYYEATGSWPVTWSDGRQGGCASTAAPGAYTYVYPSTLGAGDTDHPIIVWGNGTSFDNNTATCSYQISLRHLASHGFVVISPNDGSVGYGTEMSAAVDHMISQNSNPSSVFYNKLDVGHVGAMGHSQGAGGAVNAAKLNPQIDAIATLSFTDPGSFLWGLAGVFPAPTCVGITEPTFFVHSSTDGWATAGGQQTYYNQTSGPAIRATQIGGDHNNLFASTGYFTAWMRYQLFGDIYARTAFVGSPGEIFTHPGFQGVFSKSLT